MFWDNASERAADRRYRRELAQRKIDWQSDKNVWNMKQDQYDIDFTEAVNAGSRQTAAIQRDFGLEADNFRKSYESQYRDMVSKMPVDEGNRSRSFGRSSTLAHLYNRGAARANLKRRGIKQDEQLRQVGRNVLTMQQQALGERGFAPNPRPAPVKPTKRNALERTVETIGTIASLGASFKAWGDN
tara:strand:+ start:115 stop:672 length:558 start_codon:yes stop_codon:yes gene_type:complete